MTKLRKAAGIVVLAMWVIVTAILCVPQTTTTRELVITEYAGSVPIYGLNEIEHTYIPLIDEIIPLWVNRFPESLLVIIPYMAILVGAIWLIKPGVMMRKKEADNARR